MVISGSWKHRYNQPEIQVGIRQVLNCCYNEASNSLFCLVSYKNDSAVLAIALETPSLLGIDHYIYVKNKGDYYRSPPNKNHIDG